MSLFNPPPTKVVVSEEFISRIENAIRSNSEKPTEPPNPPVNPIMDPRENEVSALICAYDKVNQAIANADSVAEILAGVEVLEKIVDIHLKWPHETVEIFIGHGRN
jgi:hypothetical protein